MRSHSSRVKRANSRRGKRFDAKKPNIKKDNQPNSGGINFSGIISFIVDVLDEMNSEKIIDEFVRSDTAKFTVTRGEVTIHFLVFTREPKNIMRSPYIVIGRKKRKTKLRSFVRGLLDSANVNSP